MLVPESSILLPLATANRLTSKLKRRGSEITRSAGAPQMNTRQFSAIQQRCELPTRLRYVRMIIPVYASANKYIFIGYKVCSSNMWLDVGMQAV